VELQLVLENGFPKGLNGGLVRGVKTVKEAVEECDCGGKNPPPE
jgi:hypothetical protein